MLAPSSLVRANEEARISLARRFTALLGSGRVDELDALITPDCHDHNPLPFQPPGRDGVCWKLAFWRAQMPLAVTEVLDLAAIHDGVEVLWETVASPGEAPTRWRVRFTMQGRRISAVEAAHVG